MKREGREGILLILNPVAGKGRGVDLLHTFLPILEERGSQVAVYYTREAGDAIRVIRTEGRKYERIVVAGGDGTLHELVNGVLPMTIPMTLAYLPIGTTCDFAATLGLSKDLSIAARIARNGTNRKLDIGLFQERTYFVYVASFGAFTDVSYDTPSELKNQIGQLAYFAMALKNLSNLPNFYLQMESQGQRVEGEFLFGAVLNTTQLGGLVKLNPDLVALDDGLFEVLLVRYPKGPIDVTSIINGFINQDFTDEVFVFFKTREVLFHFDEEIAWTLDGEFGGSTTKAEIRVLRKAWNLLT